LPLTYASPKLCFVASYHSKVPFLGEDAYLSSPSRSYSLSIQAAAMAEVFARQKSPNSRRSCIKHDPRVRLYFDGEAAESEA
jgi:hypothetical protein